MKSMGDFNPDQELLELNMQRAEFERCFEEYSRKQAAYLPIVLNAVKAHVDRDNIDAVELDNLTIEDIEKEAMKPGAITLFRIYKTLEAACVLDDLDDNKLQTQIDVAKEIFTVGTNIEDNMQWSRVLGEVIGYSPLGEDPITAQQQVNIYKREVDREIEQRQIKSRLNHEITEFLEINFRKHDIMPELASNIVVFACINHTMIDANSDPHTAIKNIFDLPSARALLTPLVETSIPESTIIKLVYHCIEQLNP